MTWQRVTRWRSEAARARGSGMSCASCALSPTIAPLHRTGLASPALAARAMSYLRRICLAAGRSGRRRARSLLPVLALAPPQMLVWASDAARTSPAHDSNCPYARCLVLQFAPDELAYTCNRTWTADPGLHEPKRFRSAVDGEPMPCWRTCWTPISGSNGGGRGAAHCTAECPRNSRPAAAWRAAWDAQLAGFLQTSEGRAWSSTMSFVKPLKKADFIYNVY